MDEVRPQDSRIPLYHQIYDALRQQIEDGVYLPGDQIPTEAELSASFGVSRITVKQAIKKLVQESMLYRKQGKGTFVCQPKVNRKLNRLISFNDEMLQKGMVPRAKVLEVEVITARRLLAEALHIPEGEKVVRIRRLRTVDDEVMAVQTSHVPASLVPGLIEKTERLSGSLYRVLREDYGCSPAYGKESYSAVVLDGSDAEVLGVPDGTPAFAAKRIAYLQDGRPIEYVESLLRGDRYVLDIELEAPDM